MEKTNDTLVLDLWDVHQIRVNVEDKSMTFVEAVETEARSQGVSVTGADNVDVPEKHLYIKEKIIEALNIMKH
ncbi:hypothetical protein [Paenibacillus sp. S150]|uniref:hypothetical protein n=1 Tax=Paenibacillus sp. S150 TaxID=2749826 RepID=UPI001C59364F|nr:hypothetical protein [Paenibacillus sp. S150]MBW4082263.1 hypothetical protein [Paenibacillus sp. S150]